MGLCKKCKDLHRHPHRTQCTGSASRRSHHSPTHQFKVLRLPQRKLVPVAQLADARPSGLVGSAQHLEDVQQLLQLAVTWEHRLLETGEWCRAKRLYLGCWVGWGWEERGASQYSAPAA